MHALAYEGESATDAQFRCATCGTPIWFNKPGVGEPAAVPSGAEWAPPVNPEEWMVPCTL